jgi:hypothetical protein
LFGAFDEVVTAEAQPFGLEEVGEFGVLSVTKIF